MIEAKVGETKKEVFLAEPGEDATLACVPRNALRQPKGLATTDQVRRAYDVMSVDYDTGRDRSLYFRIIEAIEAKSIFENVSFACPVTVLEVGCGTGRFIELVSREAKSTVVGLDYSPRMLEVAAAKPYSTVRANIALVNGKAGALPFKNGSFDLVYSFKTLPHVQDTVKAVGEMARVAKRRGAVILEFYNSLSLSRLVRKFGFLTKWHTPAKAKRIAEGAGLTVKRVYGARTVIPAGLVCDVPFLSTALRRLECSISATRLAKLSGYYILACQKRR